MKSLRKSCVQPQKSYHYLLEKTGQFTFIRIRTGHNRFNSHMYMKVNTDSTAICTCWQAPQGAEHVLQDYIKYS